jgi:hypothetical protein
MPRLSLLLPRRLATARSSRQSRSLVLTSWLETSCRKLRRTLAMRACTRDSRRTALAWLEDRRWVRDALRDCVLRLSMLRWSGLGAAKRPTSVLVAVAATAKAERPRSTPTNPCRHVREPCRSSAGLPSGDGLLRRGSTKRRYLPYSSPTLLEGRQCTTKVDSGLLEYLCRYFVSPYQTGHLLGDDSVRRDNEAAPSRLASLPGVECVDQIEPGPWHGYRWVTGLCLERVGDQSQTLAVRKAGSARMTSQHPRLSWCRVQREPECGMPHDGRERT